MIGRGRDLSRARHAIVLRVRGSRVARLDHYLKGQLAWRSRTRIQRLIRDGFVTVNGHAAKPSLRVRPGDEIRVSLSLGTGIPDYASWRVATLYEDPWLLGLDKPPGLLVHPVGRHVYDTLMNYLHYRYRERMETAPGFHLRLCHRLDKDTTGLVIVGKEHYVHHSVQRQLERRAVFKEYLALVEGAVSAALTRVETPLREGRDIASATTGPGLKPSRTDLRVIERFTRAGAAYTWIAAHPRTGRQNQIRVHLRYGAGTPPADFPGRFLLHSSRLRLYHPRLKSRLELEAPLPEDVEATLARLRAGD
jgi:23S rRNA pseudouridine1911/1915/1917 synthase